MTLYYTFHGKTVGLTERATVVPREGDIMEIQGENFGVKKVIWHINEHTTEVEVQILNYSFMQREMKSK
jgi:hypothetical protein